MPCGIKASIPRGSCLYTSASPQLPNLRPGCPHASQARCRNHQETWSSLARRRCQPCPCSGPGRLGRPSPSCPGCPSCPGPSSSMTRRAHPEPGTAQLHGVSDFFLPQRSRIIFWEWLFHQNFRWCLPPKKIGNHIWGLQNSWFLWELGARRAAETPSLALLRCFDTGVPAPSATNQMFRHVLSPVPSSIKSMGVDGKCVKPNFKFQNWFRWDPPQSSVPLWPTTDWISFVFDAQVFQGQILNQAGNHNCSTESAGSHNQLPSELCIQYHLSETTGWIYHNLPKWFLQFYPTGHEPLNKFPAKKMKT